MRHFDRFTDLEFPAKLTAVTDSSGTYLYSWTEQYIDPLTGDYQNASPARYGTATIHAAREVNNLEIDVTGTPIVRMKVRGAVGGQAVFEFEAGALATSSSITVSGDNISSFYTSWTTGQLIFDATTVPDVWYIAGDGVGPTTVTIRPAYADGTGGSAYPGVVTVDPQSFVGAKTFWDGVVAKEYTANYTSTSITFDVRGLSRTDGSSTEEIIFGDESTNGYIRLKKTVSSTWWQLTFGDVTPGGDGVNSTGLFLYSSNDATSNPGLSLKTIIHAGYFVAGTKYQVVEESGGIYTTREGRTGFILPGAYAIGGIITNLGSSGSNGQIYIGNGSGFTLATLTAGNGISITNGSGSITIAAATQMSITADGSGLKLSGDSATPGNNYFYGTDGSGTKGWYSTSSFGYTQEQIEDIVGNMAGTTDSVLVTYNDPGGAITWDVRVNSSVSSIETAGGLALDGDVLAPGNNYYYGTDGTGSKGWYTLPSGSYTDEQAQDAVGTSLVDTDTINFTYDDAMPQITADVRVQMSITSDSSGLKLVSDSGTPGNNKYYGTDGTGSKGWYTLPSGSYTDEQAQDAIGNNLVDSNTIDFTYDDAMGQITADAKTQMSITSDSSGLKLVSDSGTPGNNKYYGTDGTGTKGWNALPAGLNYVTAPTYSDDSGSVGDYSVDATYVYFYLNGTWRRWAFDAGFGPAPP